MARKYRKRGRMPKLLSPINSYEGAVRVIRAGADEIYCGVGMPEKLKHFTLYRGPGSSPAQLPTYDELSKIVNHAHEHNVKVILTVNEPFMSEALQKAMESHIRSCIDEGVDALMVGDFGVLSIIRRLGVDVPLIASTYFVSMNCKTVDFLERLGFSRVVLERHLTLQEISRIVGHSKVPVEVFCHAGGCSNINANCYFYHYGLFSKIVTPELKLKHMKGIVSPCTLFYDVCDVTDKDVKLCNIPILDAFTFCSLCHLQTLVQIGVGGLKIVGRFNKVQEQEAYTMIYRELLDMIKKGRGRVQPGRLQDKIESLRRKMDEVHLGRSIEKEKTRRKSGPKKSDELRMKLQSSRYKASRKFLGSQFRDVICKQKRCFFSPLFNAPYTHFTSWDPRKHVA